MVSKKIIMAYAMVIALHNQAAGVVRMLPLAIGATPMGVAGPYYYNQSASLNADEWSKKETLRSFTAGTVVGLFNYARIVAVAGVGGLRFIEWALHKRLDPYESEDDVQKINAFGVGAASTISLIAGATWTLQAINRIR